MLSSGGGEEKQEKPSSSFRDILGRKSPILSPVQEKFVDTIGEIPSTSSDKEKISTPTVGLKTRQWEKVVQKKQEENEEEDEEYDDVDYPNSLTQMKPSNQSFMFFDDGKPDPADSPVSEDDLEMLTYVLQLANPQKMFSNREILQNIVTNHIPATDSFFFSLLNYVSERENKSPQNLMDELTGKPKPRPEEPSFPMTLPQQQPQYPQQSQQSQPKQPQPLQYPQQTQYPKPPSYVSQQPPFSRGTQFSVPPPPVPPPKSTVSVVPSYVSGGAVSPYLQGYNTGNWSEEQKRLKEMQIRRGSFDPLPTDMEEERQKMEESLLKEKQFFLGEIEDFRKDYPQLVIPNLTEQSDISSIQKCYEKAMDDIALINAMNKMYRRCHTAAQCLEHGQRICLPNGVIQLSGISQAFDRDFHDPSSGLPSIMKRICKKSLPRQETNPYTDCVEHFLDLGIRQVVSNNLNRPKSHGKVDPILFGAPYVAEKLGYGGIDASDQLPVAQPNPHIPASQIPRQNTGVMDGIGNVLSNLSKNPQVSELIGKFGAGGGGNILEGLMGSLSGLFGGNQAQSSTHPHSHPQQQQQQQQQQQPAPNRPPSNLPVYVPSPVLTPKSSPIPVANTFEGILTPAQTPRPPPSKPATPPSSLLTSSPRQPPTVRLLSSPSLAPQKAAETLDNTKSSTTSSTLHQAKMVSNSGFLKTFSPSASKPPKHPASTASSSTSTFSKTGFSSYSSSEKKNALQGNML